MNLIQQFKNLFDPSTALGAFLISFFAGVLGSLVVGFFSGRKYQESIQKENNVDVIEAGDIIQDVHKINSKNMSGSKIVKKNTIRSGTVSGTIKQDVDE